MMLCFEQNGLYPNNLFDAMQDKEVNNVDASKEYTQMCETVVEIQRILLQEIIRQTITLRSEIRMLRDRVELLEK